METEKQITALEVQRLHLAGAVVNGYPLLGRVVVNGWKTFKATHEVAKLARILCTQANKEASCK